MSFIRQRSSNSFGRAQRNTDVEDDRGGLKAPEPTYHPFSNITSDNNNNNSSDAKYGKEEGSSMKERNESRPIPTMFHESSAINNFQYIIGLSAHDLPGGAYQPVQDDEPIAQQTESKASGDFMENFSIEEKDDIVERFKQSFALSKSFAQGSSRVPNSPMVTDHSVDDHLDSLPIPYTETCASHMDLNNDSMDYYDFWLAFRSTALFNNALFGFRVMVFAVFPAFVLVQSPATSGYFAAGLLLPTFSAALALPNVGAQCQMTVMMCQTAFVIYVWGTFVQMTNMCNHMVAWWFSLFFSCFAIFLIGDVPAKRVMIVFVIMMMLSELQAKPGPDSHFPLNFARDFVYAALFPQLASFLPYPIFAYRLANDNMKKLHSLYAAALGNAIKSFWAPVLIDAQIARKQIPFTQIRSCGTVIEGLMKVIPYEPFEFGLKNIFRRERLAHLAKIRWCLYSLSAISSLHTDLKQVSLLTPLSDDFKQSQKRMQDLALKLSAEMIIVLNALGSAMRPEEVLKIDFGPLAERSIEMEDMIRCERENTLLAKKFSLTETNHILRTFSFHFSVLKIVDEILKIESWATNFDEKKYPGFFTRAFNFTIGDYWRDFWIELPKRLTLATPRDVRMVKDGIRYGLGFTVAVAFTMTTSYHDTYYFGMAILARIAQQTASETLQIGIMRVCGLAFGASFAHLIARTTTDLWGTVGIMLALGFLCVTVQQHALYGQVGQYGVVSLIAGIPLARQSTEKLMNRVTDNVFAFSFYLIICLVVFPVDPIRVVSNYRSKCLKAANDITQSLVVLGCCPASRSMEETQFIVEEAEKALELQRLNLAQSQDWNTKASIEPAIRGDVFPTKASSSLTLHLAEFSSLQSNLLDSMKSLHRPRTTQLSFLIREILELIRPFLLDCGQLLQRFFQLVIDATEQPFDWSLEQTALQVWRGQLAMLSLRKVTGNIQRSFIAALMPDKGLDKSTVNKYMEAASMEAAMMYGDISEMENQGSFCFQALMTSFRRAKVKSTVSREDLCVFESIVVHFALMMRTMSNCMEDVIEIHGYEQSRRQ